MHAASLINPDAPLPMNNVSADQSSSLSVVIPFYNEAGNAGLLIDEVHEALAHYAGVWELIAVNDGSSDHTAAELDQARQRWGAHVQVIHFARNFGQTAAMQAGIDAARGELIATMDGDRQNDPADIPRLIDHLLTQDLDMVAGWRRQRQDAAIKRKLPSQLANRLIRKVTGVQVTDNGCSLKVYRASIIKQVVLMGEMHRFIPAWVASVTDPARIGELAVNHRARCVGQSKYGLSRVSRVILDLISVLFFMKFNQRPGHFFGQIGISLGLLGGLIFTYLLGLKVFLGADIGSRPLFFTAMLLSLGGLQLLTTGVLAEVMTRSGTPRTYPQRQGIDQQARGWHE